MYRTDYCGQLDLDRVGNEIELAGWVSKRRDLGGITFVDLRDRTGIIQLLFNPENADTHGKAQELSREDVISVKGKVIERDPENVNPDIQTGDIELQVETLDVLNEAQSPPYYPSDSEQINEVTKLKYRYMDLRGPRMQSNVRLRHETFREIRKFFDGRGFRDIETPILTKSTPEGARDFLVPSRIHKGSFYALPQSPQLFKQLFMIGGMDKYYQIAKCFRDEDLRADRQPEFTQLDMEMSFVEEDDVISTIEAMIEQLFHQVLGMDLNLPLPRLSYKEAMSKYGSDRPDLRYDLTLVDISDLVEDSDFGIFSTTIEEGGVVKGIRIPQGKQYPRSKIDALEDQAVEAGAQGLLWASQSEGTLEGSFSDYLTDDVNRKVIQRFDSENGDLIILMADAPEVANEVLGQLRTRVANDQNLIGADQWEFLWVTDFPLFSVNEEGNLTSEHHPFTSPRKQDLPLLEDNPSSVTARAYDIVLNGTELGGGSIRIHRPDLQRRIFEVLGITEREAQEKFGFFLEALNYGAPPHGGIALGLDRLIMLMAGEDSIRDVIPFPKTGMAQSPLTGAPMEVSEEQLRELGIQIREE